MQRYRTRGARFPYTRPQESTKILLKASAWYQAQRHVCAKARLRNPGQSLIFFRFPNASNICFHYWTSKVNIAKSHFEQSESLRGQNPISSNPSQPSNPSRPGIRKLPTCFGGVIFWGGPETLEKRGRTIHRNNLLEEFAEKFVGNFSSSLNQTKNYHSSKRTHTPCLFLRVHAHAGRAEKGQARLCSLQEACRIEHLLQIRRTRDQT